jgi:hypothetical protein
MNVPKSTEKCIFENFHGNPRVCMNVLEAHDWRNDEE